VTRPARADPRPDPRRLEPWQTWALAIVATGATLGLRLALGTVLAGRPTFVLFALPILLSAYLGGLRSGLLATVLSCMATSFFLLPPLRNFRVDDAAEGWQQFFLVVAGVAISIVCEALHRARQRADVASGELQAEKARLVEAQAVAKLGSWETDISTRRTTWSDETYRIFGKDPAVFSPTHEGFLDCVHPDDREAVDRAFVSSFASSGVQSIEHRVLGPDGDVTFVEERWQAFAAGGGRPARAVGTCQDVSDRKRAETAFADLARRTEQRERMLTTTLSYINDFAYIYDRDGRFLFVNKPLLDLWGLPLEEAVGKNFFDLGYPHDLAEQLQRQVQEVFASGTSLTGETPYTSPSGLPGVYEYIFAPAFGTDGSVEFVVGSTRDITERQQVHDALRQSLAEFRLLAESIPQVVWVTRPDGWNVYVNQQWTDYTGLRLDESTGHGWNKPFHPDDQQRARDAWALATTTSSLYSVECRLRRADGVYRWWLIRGVPVRDAAGAIVKWFGTCTDIHDLKLAAQAISESAERFATVFNSNLIALGIAERSSGRFIDVNARSADFFGYTRDEMIGHTTFELGLWVDPSDRAQLIEGIAEGSTPRAEVQMRRKSGEIRDALVSMEAITLAGIAEPLAVSGILDITERKQLEAQLLQAQKMEAVGRLAGGVAHDFNNALGIILAYTERLQRSASAEHQSALDHILKATHRASDLTRQLLAFSRGQAVDPQVLDLGVVVAALEPVLARLLGAEIALAVLPGPDPGPVKVDPSQIESVIINLCLNAREAMPAGGALRIETANVRLDAAGVGAAGPQPGEYVLMTVSDTGHGIDEGVLSKVFEPFFTTKEFGKGSGLGLAMVYGIVRQAGGSITVDSEAGRGAVIEVYLPRIDAVALAPRAFETPSPTRAHETILLVEDEPSLRSITRETLMEEGYRVLDAASGEEAIALAASTSDVIHLLLTDVMMPGMKGPELAASLEATHPRLKVVFMSGYTSDALARRGAARPGMSVLEKPFNASSLFARVREALEEQPVPAK
jgi:two-component system cell cycle sensor histidine kinase/response regulator CckA